MTILVDIDDVLIDMCGAWCRWLNNKHGTNVSHEDITDWDMTLFFPELTKDEIYAPLIDENFWQTVEPKKDAIDILKMFVKRKYDVYLCTSTDYRNVKIKYDYVIKKYFPFIDWQHVIIAEHKQMVKADVLIDDAVHNLEGGDYQKILMTAPHNRLYDPYEHDMFRADDWEDVDWIITLISSTKEVTQYRYDYVLNMLDYQVELWMKEALSKRDENFKNTEVYSDFM